MAAQLMALTGDRPVLILAPKALVWQWQDEMQAMPRIAVGRCGAMGSGWTSGGIGHPSVDATAIRQCPRRVGIVSTGLITSGSGAVDFLAALRFRVCGSG